ELHMVAGVRDVDEPQVGVTEAGSIDLQRGEAPNAYLRAGDKLSAEHLRVADQLHLHGREITAPDIVDTDGGRLDSLFTAGNGGLADRISLGIQTSGDIFFAQGYAQEAGIDTNSDHVHIEDGWIGHTLRQRSANTDLLMDNIDATSRPVDVQLHELDKRFTLDVAGQTAITDAYVTHYRLGWETTLPNYTADHQHDKRLVDSPSAALDAGRWLQRLVDMKASWLYVPNADQSGLPMLAPFVLLDDIPVNLEATTQTDDERKTAPQT